jgi:Spondin_N
MNKILMLLFVAALALAVAGCSENNPASPVSMDEDSSLNDAEKHYGGNRDRTATYEVVIENLTPATGPGASQPFAPPILATHKRGYHVFQARRRASEALAGVAEDAMNQPLVDLLNASRKVNEVTAGSDVILPAGSASFEISAEKGAKYLSLVFMLVNTNDAFGGLDSVRLPRHGSRTILARAWDAGSEMNSELMSDIPGPCCGNPGSGTDEFRRIRRHRGIMGTGDLDADVYGWEGRVAKITITRID